MFITYRHSINTNFMSYKSETACHTGTYARMKPECKFKGIYYLYGRTWLNNMNPRFGYVSNLPLANSKNDVMLND